MGQPCVELFGGVSRETCEATLDKEVETSLSQHLRLHGGVVWVGAMQWKRGKGGWRPNQDELSEGLGGTFSD